MKPFVLDQIGIGSDFKKAREALGLTLTTVAEESGVALSHIWNLENGVKEMSLEKFFSLCNVLGVPAGQMISDNMIVGQDYFATLIYSKLKGSYKSERNGEQLEEHLSMYGAGCAVVICHLLLTPGYEMSPASGFHIPSKNLLDVFTAIDFRIRNDMGLRERRECLQQILHSTLDVLEGFGLMKGEVFIDFFRSIVKTENKAWNPKPEKRLDFLLSRQGVIGKFDLVHFGQVMSELNRNIEPAVLIPEPRRKSKKQ